jgi:hypothetical protein
MQSFLPSPLQIGFILRPNFGERGYTTISGWVNLVTSEAREVCRMRLLSRQTANQSEPTTVGSLAAFSFCAGEYRSIANVTTSRRSEIEL